MKALFLGTGACDYAQALYGEAAGRFDLDARRSSAVLLDGSLLIDCGDWVENAMAIAGVNAAAIQQVCVSHSHHDHFRPDLLCSLAARAGHPIDVYADAAPLRLLTDRCKDRPGYDALRLHPAEPERELKVDGWRITPVRSNHHTDLAGERTLHFLIERAGRRLFYGTDGAWLPTATANFLRGRAVHAWLADATCGDYEEDARVFEHNTLPMVRVMVRNLRRSGAIAPDGVVALTHLAPSLHAPHARTVSLAARDGLTVAFDGMEMEV